MDQRCEVCESFRPEAGPNGTRELLLVSFPERAVLLCRGHAAIAKNSQVGSLAELRTLYAESAGQRSYIARRARLAKATFGAPRSAGRRATDRAD
jgi:hypothetical protein